MKKNLMWNVWIYDFNKMRTRSYNVFTHRSFVESIQKIIKNKDITKKELSEKLREQVLYYFWGKYEYEIYLTHQEYEQMISVYDQIILNWDRFLDYVLENI